MKTCKLALVLCVLVYLCACGETPSAPAESPGPQPLLIWSYYEVKDQREALQYLIGEFNRSQTAYTAAWKHVPFSEFGRQLAVGLTGDSQPDLVIIDNPDMAAFISQGVFQDITDEVSDLVDTHQYYPACMETVMADGRVYGLPFCANNLALFYNKDLFAEAGEQPPQNAGELIAVAQRLTADGRAGFAMSAAASEQGAFQLLPWVLEAGKSVADLGNNYTKAGLSILRELAESGAISGNCINYSQQDIAHLFISGEVAMMENGPWILPLLKEAESNYGIVPLPLNGATVLGGENLGIVQSGNREGALAFMRFYGQDGVMAAVCERSYALPPRKDLADPHFTRNPDFAVFAEQMETSVPRSSLQDWTSVSSKLNEMHRAILTGQLEPESAGEQIRQYVLENIAEKD